MLRRDGFSDQQARVLIGATLNLSHSHAVHSLMPRPDDAGNTELDEDTITFVTATYGGAAHEQFLDEQLDLVIRGAKPGDDAE
ncbi:hypothetical protein [Amycolatopsis panacis]|uniref:hypothetical protein n=1 Tax=Amycolatopsis panacis TaxID=2340917 RepID=UPI000E70E945|nr:hypothetical protein [Amycolatopsis panacis]